MANKSRIEVASGGLLQTERRPELEGAGAKDGHRELQRQRLHLRRGSGRSKMLLG
jgi:hypothetical protein